MSGDQERSLLANVPKEYQHGEPQSDPIIPPIETSQEQRDDSPTQESNKIENSCQQNTTREGTATFKPWVQFLGHIRYCLVF
jgi:hypothetical protein